MFSQGSVWDSKSEGVFGSTQTIIQYCQNICSGTISEAHQMQFKMFGGQNIVNPQHCYLVTTTGNPVPLHFLPNAMASA